MIDFHFNVSANIHFGKNAIQSLPEIIKKHTNKVMIVYGGKSAKLNGSYDSVVTTFKQHNIEWVDFGGNTSPSYRKIQQAIDICKKEDVGCVIGLGGCSCMDMAKVIAFGAKHDDLWDYLSFVKPVKGDEEHLLIGAIPTSPSGGSEADAVSEIDDEETGKHGSLYGIYADFAILNPEFTYTLDKTSTIYAALVAFAQTSITHLGGYSPISEKFSEGVLDVILDSLKTVLNDPTDYNARASLMWASSMSTMGLLSCGKDMSWPFSIYSNLEIIRKCMPISYREAYLILFPRWLATQAKYHSEDIRRYFVSALNIDGSLPLEQIVKKGTQHLIDLFESFNIPMTYDCFGTLPSYKQLEDEATEHESLGNLTPKDLVNTFLNCMKKD